MTMTSNAVLQEALKIALSHLEHMAAWITETNKKAHWSSEIYSFESLGEDMPGIRAALDAASAPKSDGSVEGHARIGAPCGLTDDSLISDRHGSNDRGGVGVESGPSEHHSESLIRAGRAE